MNHRNLLQALLLTIGTYTGIGSAQEIKLELNKMEPQPETKACRAYLVFDNSEGAAIEALQLDLILFDRTGVIARRLALDTAPLRAAKTTVKLFDIPDLDCNDVGRILINEVLECRDADGAHADCIERLTLSTRAETQLVK